MVDIPFGELLTSSEPLAFGIIQVLDNRVVVLMDPAKINQEVDPLRVNRTREKRFVLHRVALPRPRAYVLAPFCHTNQFFFNTKSFPRVYHMLV